MTLYNPAYRLIIFNPRSIDPSESTPMTPPAPAAIHSDEFKVSTIVTAGYKPYLSMPRGRKGRFDPKKSRYDVPVMQFSLIDFKVTGYTDNLHRWVTAFIGNGEGKIKFIGRRITVEESLDGGSTWAPYYAGRINDFGLNGVLKFDISCREAAAELKQKIFDNQPIPSSASVARGQLLPIGLDRDYGIIKASNSALSGSIKISTGITYIPILGHSIPTDKQNPSVYVFSTSEKSKGDADNIVTKALSSKLGNNRLNSWNNRTKNNLDTGSLRNELQFDIRHPASASDDWHTFRVVAATYGEQSFFFSKTADAYSISEVYFTELPVSTSKYEPLSTIPISNTGWLTRVMPANRDDASEANPTIIVPSHPAQILREVVAGYYSLQQDDGRIAHPIPYKNSASFAGDKDNFEYLLKDGTFPSMSAIITKSMTITDFIEKYIAPLGIGYRFEPIASGTTFLSTFVPFDNRLPLALPTESIDDTGLASATNVQWSITKPIPYIQLSYFVDTGIQFQKPAVAGFGIKEDKFPDIAISKIVSTEYTQLWKSEFTDEMLDAFDADGQPMKLQVPSIRQLLNSSDTDISDDLADYELTLDNSGERVTAALETVHNFYSTRFSAGNAEVTLKCRRQTPVDNLKPGQFCLIDVDALPDPTSHLRGGIRMMQVTEKSEDQLTVTLGLMDCGRNVQLAPPLLGHVSGSGNYRIDVPITTDTGSVRLVTQLAIMNSGDAQPAASSSKWFIASNTYQKYAIATTQSMYLGRANATTYARARVEQAAGSARDMQLPSDWAYGLSGHTSPAVTPPTGLVYTINGPYATLEWTSSLNSDFFTLVHVTAPTGSTGRLVRYAAPGIDTTTIGPYFAADNPILVNVYQADGRGAYSTGISAEFYTSSSVDGGECLAPLNFEFINILR